MGSDNTATVTGLDSTVIAERGDANTAYLQGDRGSVTATVGDRNDLHVIGADDTAVIHHASNATIRIEGDANTATNEDSSHSTLDVTGDDNTAEASFGESNTAIITGAGSTASTGKGSFNTATITANNNATDESAPRAAANKFSAVLLYPFKGLEGEHNLPTRDKFAKEEVGEGRGLGVRSLTAIPSGDLVACISGIVTHQRGLHTLQINQHAHLLDLDFVGFLTHSCSPNVRVCLSEFKVWALADIGEGDVLTMDYASTEDVLFRQFECCCTSPNCRGWITGRRETLNLAGQDFMRRRESLHTL